VSRLLRDRLLVSLAPGAVALARAARGLRPCIDSKHVIECDPAFGAEPWQGAADTLAKAIEPIRDERVDVTVVLSNHFARYAVVPSDTAITSLDEELALARFHFTKIYGERARNWDVRTGNGRHGAPRIASAVDAALIQAVRACFPGNGKARLVSVQPYLMSAFNLWRDTMAKEDAWLLLVEPQRACLALIADGAWSTVQASNGEFPAPEDWALLLDRQQLRTGAASASRTVLVHAPDSRRTVSIETGGWKFVGLAPQPVDGFLPLEDRPLAMALTAR
jgi:hypothetical protein